MKEKYKVINIKKAKDLLNDEHITEQDFYSFCDSFKYKDHMHEELKSSVISSITSFGVTELILTAMPYLITSGINSLTSNGINPLLSSATFGILGISTVLPALIKEIKESNKDYKNAKEKYINEQKNIYSKLEGMPVDNKNYQENKPKLR